MLCPQHILSRCGWVGPHVFYEETKYPPLSSHPVSSGLSDPFFLFGPFDHASFCLELESHSNPNNLVDRSPQHGEKRMRCPSEFEGHVSSVHMSFIWIFYTWLFSWRRVVLRDWFFAIQDETTWRSFSVFCFLFSHCEGGVDQGPTLCWGVPGAWRFQLTCNNKNCVVLR